MPTRKQVNNVYKNDYFKYIMVSGVYLAASASSRSTMALYSLKPPSMLLTVPPPQTHSSLQTIRIKRSS